MIIAEIGINHGGDIRVAKEMIDEAKAAGADIAKFQWYRPEIILGKGNPHLKEAMRAQFAFEQHLELRDHCRSAGIEWLVSCFHVDQVQRLLDAGMKRFKIASRAALDGALVRAIAATGRPAIISVGLCRKGNIDEISRYFGPNSGSTYLYCLCRYPTQASDVDLNQMLALADYGSYGFSSHCPDISPALTALSMGATVIEQHVTLSKTQPGCDVSSSITFGDLKRLCDADINLEPVKTNEQVEWLRVHRNDPNQYRWFRQDAPITPEQQRRWWRTLNKSSVKLFLITRQGTRLGYIGFNPISFGAKRAEFGMFILKGYQGRGIGTAALKRLLNIGFAQYGLSTIYSDALRYPDEDRFGYYQRFGFQAFPAEHQTIQYKKQGVMVPSIKFFMTRDMWENNDKDHNHAMGPAQAAAPA